MSIRLVISWLCGRERKEGGGGTTGGRRRKEAVKLVDEMEAMKKRNQKKKPEEVGLTSRISWLALGDVASLRTLMATGIFTFSPSGIHRP